MAQPVLPSTAHPRPNKARPAATATTAEDLSVLLVTGGYDNTIRFWEAWSGVCSRTLTHQEHQVNRLSISPDKRFLAAAGHGTVKLYDIAQVTSANNVAPLLTLSGHTNNITSLAWHAESKWLVSGSEDGTIKIWDIRSTTPQRNYAHQSAVNDIELHSNQGELASCDQEGKIRLWDLAGDMCSKELICNPEEEIPLRSISIANDGLTMIAGAHNGLVYIWSVEPGQAFTDLKPKSKFVAHNRYLIKVLISPDTKSFATCSADTTVRIWGSDSRKYRLEKELAGHQRWVWDMAYSADSAYLVSCSSDHTARLWELASGTTVRQYSAHHKACVCIALNDSSA